MKKCIFCFLLLGIWLHTDSFVYPSEDRIKSYFCPSAINTLEVSDWQNPTFGDFLLIQKHLNERLKNIIVTPTSKKCFSQEHEGWITYRLGRLKLVDSQENLPQFNIVYLNDNPNKKDKCIITYGGYNYGGRDYIQGINYMIQSLKASKFNGHFIYRIGGWPSLKRGRLRYADVPYAFKPFFFEEVRDLGYKQILWLDSASIPVKSLDPIFNFIKKQGCCFISNRGQQNHEWVKRLGYVMSSLGVPIKSDYQDILTQVVGFDVSNKKANQLLDKWIEAAIKKVPFLTPSADQFSFAILVHELNLLNGRLPYHYNKDGRLNHLHSCSDAIIFHSYDFLDPKMGIPDQLFK